MHIQKAAVPAAAEFRLATCSGAVSMVMCQSHSWYLISLITFISNHLNCHFHPVHPSSTLSLSQSCPMGITMGLSQFLQRSISNHVSLLMISNLFICISFLYFHSHCWDREGSWVCENWGGDVCGRVDGCFRSWQPNKCVCVGVSQPQGKLVMGYTVRTAATEIQTTFKSKGKWSSVVFHVKTSSMTDFHTYP